MASRFAFAQRSHAQPARQPSRAVRPRGDVAAMLRRSPIQAKLTVGPAHDAHEAEADHVADKVMRMGDGRHSERTAPVISPLDSATSGSVKPGNLQRACAECEEEMQRKPVGDAAGPATATGSAMASGAKNTIRSLQGGGVPLPASERAYFEPRFGRSFAGVRIHDGAQADAASRSISARAFTLGGDIAFAGGEYRPGTTDGRRLMAHELTHTVQQGAEGTIRRAPPASPPPAPAAPPESGFSVTYTGCTTSPYTQATIEKAAKVAYEKVKNTDCISDPVFRAQILAEFKGLTIDCEQNADGPCGRASRYLSKTINLYPDGLKMGTCGPLEATILHEIIHLTEWGLLGHGDLAGACEKSCFNFGSGDAAKCTRPEGPLTTTTESRGNFLGGTSVDYAALAGIPLDQRGKFYAIVGGYSTLVNNLASSRQLSFMTGALTGFRYQLDAGGATKLNLDLQARAGGLTTLSPLSGLPQSPAFTASGGLGLGLTHDTSLAGQNLQVDLNAGVQVGRIIGVPTLDQPYFNAGLNLILRFGPKPAARR